jgi:RNA polymerase sigma-70 factor (ECF subfamily)
LNGFREDSTFSTWLSRIAINEALMLLRQRRVTSHHFETYYDDIKAVSALDLADDRPTPEQALANNELHAVLKDAISRLRGTLQSVVVLRELQGLTSAQTAQRLGLSVAAVKARIFHARRHLRRHLRRNCKVQDSVKPAGS